MTQDSEQLVDAFVASVNGARREPMLPEAVPERLRAGNVAGGLVRWHIVPVEAAPPVDEVEAGLPWRIPEELRALIERYEFPASEAGGVLMLAKTAEGVALEWRETIFADPTLSAVLFSSRTQ